jgi:hypothetical protein
MRDEMRKNRVGITYCLATLLVAFVAGCGHEVVTVPSVVSTVPAQGATNVAVNTTISATFNMVMNPATISATTFTVTGPSGAVAGSVTYSGTTATFTPTGVLAYSTLYTATITTGAANLGGTSLLNGYVWTFTTITPPPTVTAVVPAIGATSVPIGQVLTATFNEAMLCSTLASPATTFIVTGPGATTVAGTVTCSGSVATFTPAAPLAYNTLYTATITTGAQDLAGTPLAANYPWTFTTITPPPTVTATVPVNTATGVLVTQALTATFNEAMTCSTLASPATTFTVTGPGTTAVAGTVSCSGAVATFTPAASLAFNTLYTATINTGAKSLAGTPMALAYPWTFLTVPAPTPPTVISTVPTNSAPGVPAVGVPINQALSATFSVAMTPATISSTTFTLKVTGGASVTGVVTYVAAGSVATFTPNASLASNTAYTATITTGAQNLAGTALASNYVWTFTTAAAPVVIPPTVTSTIPANQATAVALNQIVSATFNKAMTPATITATSPATFTLLAQGSTTPVTGLVAYAAIGNTLTFIPTANLVQNTLYTATITTAAQDLAGDALNGGIACGSSTAGNCVWTFTTGTTLNAVPPQIVLTVPANNASNVATNQAVSATFSKAMNPLTLTNATFQLYTGTAVSGTSLQATITYDAINFIATLTPTATLTANTYYTAVVTNGATDLAGNPLGSTPTSPYTNPWTFQTGAAAVPPPVVLGPHVILFGAFGGGAGITNEGIYTVVNADIGTTGVSTTITGFHDDSVISSTGVPQCTYTEGGVSPGTGLVGAFSATSPGTGVISIFTAPGTSQPTSGCPNEASGPATLAGTTAYIAQQAANEALAAYNTLQYSGNPAAGTTPSGVKGASLPGNLGGLTLAPGTWTNASTVGITGGDLTLDAGGDPNVYWVFQIGSTLTVGDTAPRSVKLINGAKAANVYWAVGSAATINYGGGGTMVGTIISTQVLHRTPRRRQRQFWMAERWLCLRRPPW